MTESYTLQERLPTLEEYRALCTSVGWEDFMNFDVAQTSLDRSVFGVVVVRDGEAVGMGRIVGDGAIYFYIQDIAVHPAHQKQGLGTRIMGALMAYLQTHAPEKAFVGLFAAEGTQPFYRHYAFDAYPALTGMFTVINRQG